MKIYILLLLLCLSCSSKEYDQRVNVIHRKQSEFLIKHNLINNGSCFQECDTFIECNLVDKDDIQRYYICTKIGCYFHNGI